MIDDWRYPPQGVGSTHQAMRQSCFHVVGHPSQSHEMLFDAHTRSFIAFGGMPKRGIYNNMKTAVDKVSKGNGRLVNTRFFAMTAHYLFDPDFCNVASGWEKSVVEKNVQNMRRRIWNEAKQQQFGSFEDLNHWLEARCRALWSEIEYTDYAGITLADALEQVQLCLIPLPTPFDGYIEVLARVSSTCLITLQRNRYSVHCRLANQMVAVHQYADRIEIVNDSTVDARHVRLLDSDQVILDELGYLPFSQAGGALLFHLLSRLYERASVIITTNLAFAEWSNVFIDAKMTTSTAGSTHTPLPHYRNWQESFRYKQSTASAKIRIQQREKEKYSPEENLSICSQLQQTKTSTGGKIPIQSGRLIHRCVVSCTLFLPSQFSTVMGGQF